jgi:triacylglycerol lipase
MSIATAILSALLCSLLLPRPASARAKPAATGSTGDYVVLLHGYGRTAWSMTRLACHLKHQGYRVINESYPGTRLPVEALSDAWLQQLLDRHLLDPGAKIHFVTHSLGGIIVRQYLSNHDLDHLGRVVMLAPPNHGSEIIDALKANPVSRRFAGRNRLQLGTRPDDLPTKLGPAHFEVGIIAGNRSLNPFLSSLLPGPNDGKVTVESTKLSGMRDFLVVRNTHTWLMWRTDTLRQTLNFIKSGHFDHAPTRKVDIH